MIRIFNTGIAALFMIFTVFVYFYGGSLKNYNFSSKTVMMVDMPYSGDVLVSSVLFDDFGSDNLLAKNEDPVEIKHFVNLELKKRLMKAGIKVFNYGLANSIRTSRDSREQEGTLKVTSVNDGSYIFYNLNMIKEINIILSGDIEYFQFDKNFFSSYIVIDVNLHNRETGYNYWLSTISGRTDEVLNYIINTIAPVKNDNKTNDSNSGTNSVVK